MMQSIDEAAPETSASVASSSNNNNNNTMTRRAATATTTTGPTSSSFSVEMSIRARTTTTPIGRSIHNSIRTGSSQQPRILKTIIYYGILFCLLYISYELMWTYWLAGEFIPDTEIDKMTGQVLTRRRPERTHKMDYSTHIEIPNEPIDGVMEGHLTLIDIQLPKLGGLFYRNESYPYSGVSATFCHISWQQQPYKPYTIPTFYDLKQSSPLCRGTIYKVSDLNEVVQKAKLYDDGKHWEYFTATIPDKNRHGKVDPTAVIFHESRCGSTALSNTLAAFAPGQTRVYAEAPPVIIALKACTLLNQGDNFGIPCDTMSHMQLIQDIFYMLGRITRSVWPQYVFYKLQSVGVEEIDTFTAAMPTTPWFFLYRNAIEVLMSHFPHYMVSDAASELGKEHLNEEEIDNALRMNSKLPPSNYKPQCLKNYGKSQQSELLNMLVKQADRSVASLSKEEYCAAHVASLAESAIREHEKLISVGTDDEENKSPHWFVNYNQLPYYIWESMLPNVVKQHQLTHEQIDHMHAVAKLYSKTTTDSGTTDIDEHWKDDSTVKQNLAPPAIKHAAEVFLHQIYNKMEDIRIQQQQ